MRRAKFVCVAAAALIVCGAVADEKLDEAVKLLDQKFAKVNSYVALMESVTNLEIAPDETVTTTMAGKSTGMRKGGKILVHNEVNSETTKTVNGERTTSHAVMTTVDDGTFLWMLSEKEGQKRVMKSLSSSDAYPPAGYFKTLERSGTVKRLADADVDSHDCFVFEIRANSRDGTPVKTRQVEYYCKDHGIILKSETFGEDGELITRSVIKGVKINPSVDESMFVFEVPEGVAVTDTTGSQQAEGEAQAEEGGMEEEQPKKKGVGLPKTPKFP